MTNILPDTGDNKKQICLNYLGISAKKLCDSVGLEDRIQAMRGLKHFLFMAQEYGCSEKEIRLALGRAWKHAENLLKGAK